MKVQGALNKSGSSSVGTRWARPARLAGGTVITEDITHYDWRYSSLTLWLVTAFSAQSVLRTQSTNLDYKTNFKKNKKTLNMTVSSAKSASMFVSAWC